MLAVTEVNGCEICSYGHTKYALEQGMSNEEIKSFLTGNPENISSDEMPAIIFAQHYADTKGHPSEEAWNRIVQEYGKDRKSTRLNSSHVAISYAVFCLKKKNKYHDYGR